MGTNLGASSSLPDGYTNSNYCPYLTTQEDYYKTTIYPACGCQYEYCDNFHGYCPIRD